MARIVVFAKPDNDAADSYLNACKYKRGMVVDILEDGLEVGADIEASPWWRVIEAPGKVKDYEDMLGCDPEFKDHKILKGLNPFPRKRVKRVDLDAIEFEAGNPAPDIAIVVTKQDLNAKKADVAKLPNPNVIGEATVQPEIG